LRIKALNILKLIGRTQSLLEADIASRNQEMLELISVSRFLVIGGAGSGGNA
jgi:hypothetical protein